MIEKNLHKNKIIFSISFLIIANLIFNHEFLFYFYKGEVDFSIFTDKWQLGQYLCSYELEFAKRCFNGTLFSLLNIDVTFEKIYLYNLIIFNFLIIIFINLISKFSSSKIIFLLFSIILFSPFSLNSFANMIATVEPLLYLLLTLLIYINLKNKDELIFTLTISVIAILIHEISFFIVFPFIFLIKFQNCYTQNKFNNLIIFSIANILTYILIVLFGGLSEENGQALYKLIIEIKDQNFNTARIYLTGLLDATRSYTLPTIFRNILNLNIPILFLYVFISYFLTYNAFKNYFKLDKNFFSLVKLFILLFVILVFYFLIVAFFDQIIEFIFQKNPRGAPLLRDIVLKLSFIILILTYLYILYLYGFKKLFNDIYTYSDFLLFLSPLIILLTYAVGSAYGRYVAYLLMNLTIVSIYLCRKFGYEKLNFRYLNTWLMFNFVIFIFFHIHDEGFSNNYTKLPVTILNDDLWNYIYTNFLTNF